MKSKKVQLGIVVLLVGLASVALAKQQAILDWTSLRGYVPPATVAQLATNDTMTDSARRLFYVNHPIVTASDTFTKHCPAGGEKTVVLGCYEGSDNGIYIYNVTDARLDGVEQVTAAHEMLHAAYRRLSSGQRNKVDTLLSDYYAHGLNDQRIKDTIAAYRKSEPNDVVNEMHSVFGTEVPNLPAPLEQYYRQYFSDRSKVTAYTAKYQGEFASRQTQIEAYDTQLKTMKLQIENNEAQLSTRRKALDTQSAQLQTERSSGQIAQYNSSVPAYNQAVSSYNALLAETKSLVSQYNDIVATRNKIALEEQQLVSELSASSLAK